MDTFEQMKSKLEGLLRMTQANGCSVAEAAQAAQMAQRLATKYQIDLSQLKDRVQEDYVSIRVNEPFGIRRAHMLMKIAQLNTCRVVFDPNGGTTTAEYSGCTLFGRKKTIEMVMYMYDAINNSLYQMGKVIFKQEGKRAGYNNWFINFYAGALEVIAARLKEGHRLVVDEAVNNKAIILHEDQAVDNAFNKAFPHLKSGKSYRIDDPQAYARGQRFGRELEIHQGLDRPTQGQGLVKAR